MRKLLTILFLFCFFSLRAQYPEYMPEFKVLNTKADIKNHLAINGSVVLLRGLDTLNDGAGGWYEFNSTSIATPNDTTVFQVTGVATGRWLRMLVGGGSQVTIEGDTIIINNIKIRNVLKIPLTDTTHAKKGCANIIYDTILEHFFGDVCLNGVHSAWQCFDCGTVVRAGTNVSVTGSGTSASPYIVASDDSDAFHTTFQLNDSTYVIRRPNGTADTIVISGIATGGGGGGIGTITEIRATNNFAQTWTITNPNGAITTLSLILDTTLYSTRANVDSKTITLNQGTNVTITGNPTQNLGQNPSWTIAAAGGTGLVHAYAPLITSGDTVMRRVNGLHYGMIGDGTTDNTTPLQNALIACDGQKGCEVDVPNGVYAFNGPIITSGAGGSGNPNSMIWIPFQAGTSGSRSQIRIVGESGPPPVPIGTVLAGSASWVPPTSGVIFKVNTTSFTSGAAFIGTANNGTNVYNETGLTVENITIVVKNNPAGGGPVISGINYKNGSSLICKFVAVIIDTSANRSTQPVNNVTGIETPDNNSETFNNLENTLVVGFYNGYKIGEHYTLNQAQAWGCFNGMYIKQSYHSGNSLRAGIFWCVNDIYIGDFCTLSQWKFDDEWITTGWYANVNTVKDSANLAKGQIYYTLVHANVGVDNTHFTKSGGANLYSLADAVGVAGINVTNTFTQPQNINLSIGSHTGEIVFQRAGFNLFTMGVDLTAANQNNWFLYDSAFSKARLFVDASGNTNIGGTASAVSTAGLSVTTGGFVSADNGNFNIDNANHTVGIGAVPSGSTFLLELKKSGNPYLSLNSTTSRQAALFFQYANTSKWQVGMDFSNNGTADFYIYDQANAKVRQFINTTGDVSIGGTASATSTSVMSFLNSGGIKALGTVTTAGTTGAQTINKPTGIVNFAALAQTLVVTNSLATTSSLIFATILTDDATATGIQNIVRANGSFTIKLNAAATAETAVCFWVINAQ